MRIVSGLQPSGEIHIGNYLGMLKQSVALQNDHECFYFIADLHALTELPSPDSLRQHRLEAALSYLAVGIDPQRSALFTQSDVPAHSELMWLFTTLTPVGELERMTQYKDKARAAKNFVNSGLLAYPVLMAADILAYRAEGVPVGEDQRQHLELTRHIARRFNERYGSFFPEPEAIMVARGARIMSLADPKKKMSKSHGPEAFIGLFDDPDAITRKIKRAVTDSGKTITYDPKRKPGLANLITIYALFSSEDPTVATKRFASATYAEFKTALADLLIEKLSSFREKRAMLAQSSAHVRETLQQGAQRAQSVAQETLQEVQARMGIQ